MRNCQYDAKGLLSWCCTEENNDVIGMDGKLINLHRSCARTECACHCHIDQENRDHACSTPLSRQCACNGPRARTQRREKAERIAAKAAAAEAAEAKLRARRARRPGTPSLTLVQGGGGDRPVVDGNRRRVRRPGDPR